MKRGAQRVFQPAQTCVSRGDDPGHASRARLLLHIDVVLQKPQRLTAQVRHDLHHKPVFIGQNYGYMSSYFPKGSFVDLAVMGSVPRYFLPSCPFQWQSI